MQEVAAAAQVASARISRQPSLMAERPQPRIEVPSNPEPVNAAR
jgi:hypothetical protein